MHDLTLIGVHEDGEHLLLTDPTGARFRLPLDDALRAAARKDRPRLGQLQIEIDGGLRPREVQALIRQGLSAGEVADRSGWTIEKVRRFEGPVLAEREWIAIKAQGTSVARDGAAHPTLQERTLERFRTRGVEPDQIQWDSARLDSGQWVVTVSFPAGGRHRSASWRYDPATGALRAQNDDARWLGEDDQVGPVPAPHQVEGARPGDEVFDVTAPTRGPVRARPTQAANSIGTGPGATEDELTSSIRAHHSSLRDRRGRRRAHASSTPGDSLSPTDALPLEPLAIDLEGIEPPPARPRLVSETSERDSRDAPPTPTDPDPEDSAGARDPSAAVEPSPTRKGRARVPAWDDVVFGTRSRSTTPDDT